ncbi:MAG: pyridoxamine 5'-phosphate oxidase family protein [Woeseia sp.]
MSRHPERASYELDTAFSILDEGLVAHVGITTPDGVVVLPMTYARIGNKLYLHGAVASRWLASFDAGSDVSVCVTLLDGLVLARAAFSHSMNYRSVVAFGTATTVHDDEEKQQAFKAFLEHMLPGRWDDSRQPNRKEVAATLVLSLRIDEASVKVRSGPPKDAAGDYALPHWAGVIPLSLTSGKPLPDPAMTDAPATPAYAQGYCRT